GIVEDAHRPAGVDDVLQALLRLVRLRPDAALSLDVVVEDRGVAGREEAGERTRSLRRAGAPGAGVAAGRPALQPGLPGVARDVELMEHVLDVLMALDPVVLLLALRELPGGHRHIIGLRPVGRSVVLREP